jgi:hypothetical protein
MDISHTTLTPAQKALVPKDKFDTEAAENLLTIDANTIKPLIPTLLTWLQDINWPVAGPISKLVVKHSSLAIEPVKDILRGDDEGWKYWILMCFVATLERHEQELLRPELERIAGRPTKEEKINELDVEAADILGELDKGKAVDDEEVEGK